MFLFQMKHRKRINKKGPKRKKKSESERESKIGTRIIWERIIKETDRKGKKERERERNTARAEEKER